MLTAEFYASVLLFCFASTGTLGPNAFMLISSGLNYGIKNSLPHYFGVVFGFPVLVAFIGFGLGSFFTQYPSFHQAIKILGVSYLLYLAWKIANTKSANTGSNLQKPLTFFQAAAFQWVNPKAWVIAIGAIATFTTHGNISTQIIFIIFACFLASLLCMGIWLVIGASLQTLIERPRQFQLLNIAMAFVLIVSIIPMLLTELS